MKINAKTMRHKRLMLSAVLLLGIGMVGIQAQVMIIWGNASVKTAYTLYDIKKIDFTSGSIKVATIGGDSYNYILSDLRSLIFTEVTSVVQNPIPMQLSGRISLFPNPVIYVINIQSTSREESFSVIEIISMGGSVVINQAVNSNGDVYQINVSGLAKGIYVCRLSSGLAVETIRFVKQ